MITVYVKITDPSFQPPLDVWYASTLQQHATPQKTVDACNRKAKQRGLKATYELATKEEYLAYRNVIKQPAPV